MEEDNAPAGGSEKERTESSISRRNVLRSLGVSGGAGIAGLMGSGSAAGQEGRESSETSSRRGRSRKDSGHKSLRKKYKSSKNVRVAIENNAQNLLERLYAEDFVESPNANELSAVQEIDGNVEKQEDIKLLSTFDEQTQTQTAIIRIAEEFGDGQTNIFVLPEADRSYAIIDFDDGSSSLVKTPAKDSRVVSTQNSDRRQFGAVDPEKIKNVDGEELNVKDVEIIDSDGQGVSAQSSHYSDCLAAGDGYSYCSDTSCLTLNENCIAAHCTTILHERYDVRRYICGDERHLEIYNKTCTNDCCEDSGPGCNCSSFGCSAQ